jgi:Ca-activated chloride channel family protein
MRRKANGLRGFHRTIQQEEETMRRPRFTIFLVTLIAIGLFIAPACAFTQYSASQSAPGAAPAYEAAAVESYAAAPNYGLSDEPADMFFEYYGVRGFVDAAKDNLSTFSVDVDTGSYTVGRAYVQDGFVPPPDSVRTEEYVNFFDYDYPNPEDDSTFDFTLDAASTPFLEEPDNVMMRVGIQGYTVPADERPDAVLTFVIDVSGSMDADNRLGLAKRALYLLVNELRDTDRVGIVVYGDEAYVQSEMKSMSDRDEVLTAINRLGPDGSTNAEAGMVLGYDMAAANFDPEAINRVVLISDGVANVGETGPDAILRRVKDEAEKGISLTTVGVGMGNYNDTLMEQLADDGDGFYSYVDTMDQAEKVFVEDLTSNLLTIARNAKIQVEFNEEVVESYRLMGYENRKVKDEEFREDDVDAGEVGAGHSVTALYEVDLVEDAAQDAEVATVFLRWEEPETGEVIEINRSMTVGDIGDEFEVMDIGFQLAAAVAEYAEVLRQTEYGATSVGDISEEVTRIAGELEEAGDESAEVEELAQLLWLVEGLLPPSGQSLED